MTLYLIRHAHAVTAEEDPARPLSDRGRDQVARLVAYLRQANIFQPDEIWCSSLARARETARLLTVGLKLSAPLVECPGLEPEADPRRTVARIEAATGRLAIVGHQPHLGALAALLLQDPVGSHDFKKGAIVALAGQPKPWRMLWGISPDMLGPQGKKN